MCIRAPLGQSAGGLNNSLLFHHFHYSATATEREGVGETDKKTARGGREGEGGAVCTSSK